MTVKLKTKPKRLLTIHARLPAELVRVVDEVVVKFNGTHYGMKMTRTDAFVWLLHCGLLAASGGGAELPPFPERRTGEPEGVPVPPQRGEEG